MINWKKGSSSFRALYTSPLFQGNILFTNFIKLCARTIFHKTSCSLQRLSKNFIYKIYFPKLGWHGMVQAKNCLRLMILLFKRSFCLFAPSLRQHGIHIYSETTPPDTEHSHQDHEQYAGNYSRRTLRFRCDRYGIGDCEGVGVVLCIAFRTSALGAGDTLIDANLLLEGLFRHHNNRIQLLPTTLYTCPQRKESPTPCKIQKEFIMRKWFHRAYKLKGI